jgi:GrpB-like predicted nucleotidyltransferase (UPF0157 family)
MSTTLIGGREPGYIVLIAYDAQWPKRFEEERGRIAVALGERATRIEHIGSTAVPGLAAKPIVDIVVTVDDCDDEATYAPALETAGYALRVREPGHRMFRSGVKDVHVHIWAASSGELERHLRFRDRLRENEADRRRYEGMKRKLAAPWSNAALGVLVDCSRRRVLLGRDRPRRHARILCLRCNP